MGYDILNRINVLVKKTYYTYERFQVNATFALLYHEKPLSVVELSSYVRISDQLMQLDENHYFIIFSFTEQDNAFKASQNLVHNLDIHFKNSTSCVALDTFDPSKTYQNVLNRLKQIMTETRKNPYVRIETEDILYR
ncbi:MAG: hypothetical protein A2023_06335 [Sulfuricurvum sp. GWF2_44_89]|uniref:GGDEF domain-containing protein n=1 Tax=Sulfuricurvum kujiense TaxID=148813 RepID=A0A2D3WLC0_9BACT|nr:MULTISPECIES: hypothetical protein [Sulfuricurvum]OHD77268.1 MAG: hypothetical protein A2023_06335 [Sulfuricurvum sp. GWF2_44_89]OHD91288.1 MAG: hypothetical protein A2517_03000 [Sulfuricurvum sp. RIFOXYD12_FULL_44_77]OHD91354.1 MAG: hypothetical protein A2552_04210 [Sulfuricurvum sp. RIFOXYD2_FULL_44_160]DAB39547.1 MAG TPA: hypothetical protein CFH83_00240 [Sulfuricurvum kujiense]